MILSPSLVYPGDILSLNLTVPGVDLEACSDSPESLVFSDPTDAHFIEVQNIDPLLLDSSTIRAYISVAASAVAGNYGVSYKCNADTIFTGSLKVDAPPSKLTLSVNPTSMAAGTFGTSIMLSIAGEGIVSDTETEEDSDIGNPNGFFTDNTKILFGKEDFVKITRQQQTNSEQMELTVDIDPLTPIGEMSVTAVSGGRTAKGVLVITDRVAASVSVSPNRAKRASIGDMTPNLTEITIHAEGLDFGPLDQDAGVGDEHAAVVSFPENPGITVMEGTRVIVSSSGYDIKAQIRIDASALLGQTQLHVAVGGNQEAWTDFTVDLPQGQPLLQITSPSFIPKSGKPTPVFVESVNFYFKEMKKVSCAPQCTISDLVVNPETFTNMSMNINIDSAMTASNITLEVTLPDDVSVTAYLPVKDAGTVTLRWDDDSIHQGETSKARKLTREDGGEFDEKTTVTVLPRSGLRINNVSVDNGSHKFVIISIDAAADAPTGPADVMVNSGTDHWEVLFEVEAPENIDAQQVFLSPSATLRKREIALVHVTVSNFDLPTDISGFAFDDPGLKITQMEPETDNSAVLNVDVSPRARNDMAVLYVEGEVGRAAATFKTLDFQQTEILTTADPYSVNRMSGGNTTTIQVQKQGVLFDKPLVDVNDNIDLQVTRVSGGQSLVFDLGADEFGFGGWTGLIVENDALKYLVPIYINASGNNMLTMQFSSLTVPLGSERLNIIATLPSAMTPDESVLEVVSGHSGAYVSEPHITTGRSVSFSMDVTYDAIETGGEKVPVFITTPDGAGLGEMTISSVNATPIDVGKAISVELPSEAGTRFIVNNILDNYPAFFQAETVDTNDHRAHISLIAGNALDTAASTDSGLIWMISGEPQRIVVSSAESATALINVRARESVTVEDATVEGEEWNLPGEAVKIDPCLTPFLGRGNIQRALDIDNAVMKKPSCALTAFIAARTLSDRPWETPQLRLQYFGYSADEWESWKSRYDNADKTLHDYLDEFVAGDSVTLIGEDSGSIHSDPAIFINPNHMGESTDVAVRIDPELGSAGTYLIQIRRPYIIREFSRTEGASFIEIEVPENELASCELVQYNTGKNEETARLVFADVVEDTESDSVANGDTELEKNLEFNTSTDADHTPETDLEPAVTSTQIVLIAELPMDEADFVDDVALLPPTNDFALILSCKGEIVDSVQIGAVAEGSAFVGTEAPIIPSDDRETFFRIANIDTNSDAQDFAATYFATPGK